tara:strand:+ start:31 stop:276 length:246 start_codon:yes stop_codon:yes gene_type:complete
MNYSAVDTALKLYSGKDDMVSECDKIRSRWGSVYGFEDRFEYWRERFANHEPTKKRLSGDPIKDVYLDLMALTFIEVEFAD